MDILNAKLVVIGGAPEGDEFKLVLPCTLGRSRDVSLPLPHPLVSRNHCELLERDGEMWVRDLGSTNGTFVGSERVDEAVLRHDDLLTVGTVTFRVTFAEQPALCSADAKLTLPDGETAELAANLETTAIARIETDVEIQVHKPTRRRQKAK